MPYIPMEQRNEVGSTGPLNAGQLNYCITRLLRRYLEQGGESYQTYNDMMGALEGAKLELYRRRVAGYEDGKLAAHGDVW